MKRRSFHAGTSLVEMMIAVAISVIIIGALLVSSMAIQKAIHGSEVFANGYSDQRRITDYVAREMRRALSVETEDASGVRSPLAASPVTIASGLSLVFTVPGYYASNDSSSPGFDQKLSVVETSDRLDYGDASGFAPPVEVSFRKAPVPSLNSVCFIRQEAGIDEVVVGSADDLSVQVAMSDDFRTGTIKTWFLGGYGSAGALVSTFDEVLVRNSPPNFEP